MSLPNPDQDNMLPVTTQSHSHNNARGQAMAMKDDTSVTVDSRR